LEIKFTDLFLKECRDKLRITESQVIEAVTCPDECQNVSLDDLELKFFLKKEHQQWGEDYLLVCSQYKNNCLFIDSAFYIPSEFIRELKTPEPVILLQQLALKFGLPIRIGLQLNKFIFRESIHIESLDNKPELVEILNPENHSFIQFMFIKIEQQGSMKIANCALAFCIDMDEYLSWLQAEKDVSDMIIEIAPQLRGHITPRDLIEACGTVAIWLDSSQFGNATGHLFKVACREYLLEVGFTRASFYIRRNAQKLELSIEPYKKTGYVNCYAIWQPTELALLILDRSYQRAVSSGANAITEIEKRKKILRTSPVLPPTFLITWARREGIAPVTIYDSYLDFCQSVVSALQSIPDKVATVGMHNIFWDITYEKHRIVSRKPKKERDILPLIHGLLFDIATAKNFQISPEHKTGGGLLDFLISGPLRTGEIANVCVEFKHAHSPDLEDGLLKQLPAYMRAKGCNFGVYCVMFFKGPYFNEPKNLNLRGQNAIDIFLNRKASSAGLSNIRVLIFDFSHPKPPSQL